MAVKKAIKVKVDAGMMAKKMCPFFMMRHDEVWECSCQKECCAWWNREQNCCSIKLIGDAIAGISRATK